MANTDNTGSKLPQPRTPKKIFAKNIRQKRLFKIENKNPAFCDVCGFRVGGVNHLEGEHHQQAERKLNNDS